MPQNLHYKYRVKIKKAHHLMNRLSDTKNDLVLEFSLTNLVIFVVGFDNGQAEIWLLIFLLLAKIPSNYYFGDNQSKF